MTNAEATEILKERRMCAAYVDSEYVDSVDIEAIDIAISALEKQAQEKPLTNADRIRNMSDEELARYLSCDDRVYRPCPSDTIAEYRQIRPASECYDCIGCWLDWLKQEVKDNG